MEAGANKEVKAAGDGDLSMEEILQSIRKIIAEDDTEAKPGVGGKAAGANAADDENNVPGSNVLELTEMLKDDGTVVSLKPEAAKPSEPPPLDDVLSKIDEALLPDQPTEKLAEPMPEPTPPPANPPATPDSLLSPEVATATASAFKKLQAAEMELPEPALGNAPAFRSGTTVESLMIEMLRPMLTDWLNANLPAIVERIVEKEVRKLTR